MIHCLPGFLGQGSDFGPFLGRFSAMGLGDVVCHDLFSRSPKGLSLGAWGQAIAEEVSPDPSAAVLGYSLGGRLALHALVARPEVWRAAVIVSAHTGLSSAPERRRRLADDRVWAERFDAQAWDDVIQAWNGRPVFGGRTPPARLEQDFDRAALVSALTDWSLGAQQNLLPRLEAVPCPVLWVVGEGDERFRRIGGLAVERLPRGRLEVVPNAAHRVHVDAPDAFREVVAGFLEETGSL